MDPLTHGLASYALVRAAFPRLSPPAQLTVVIAGLTPSVDSASAWFGPSAYLRFHRTYAHSLVAALVFALLFTAILILFGRHKSRAEAPHTLFTAALGAVLLHLALDLCQADFIQLLWPFSSHRFQLDWLNDIDLVVLAILLVGVLLPLLAALVTQEIGARSKSPRGHTGAIIALLLVAAWIGGRAVLHSNAIATLDSRSYRGESPRRSAAFPQSISPFSWHGIVETESALHFVDLSVGPLAQFDAESAITAYKPEPSPALEAARKARAAERFLSSARFPKASAERTPTGYHVELRDFPYAAGAISGRHVAAFIDTDLTAQIVHQELAWDQSGPK